MASRGYPDATRGRASRSAGIEDAEALGALVFHAGTALRDGTLRQRGRPRPRVTALGADRRSARDRPIAAVERIDFPGASYRRDIAAAVESADVTVPDEHCSPNRTPAAEPIFEEFQEQGPLVGILIGSESDREAMEPAVEELNARGISNELRVLSAHRDPRGVAEYASTAALRGVRVIIAAPGMAAALPGVVAAYTDLPVIGVPLSSSKSVTGRSRRGSLDRADAAGRAGRLRLGERLEERRRARGQDPGAGRRLPRAAERDRVAPGRAQRAPPVECRVIPRYSRPAMKAIWSEEAKLARWLEVELAATDAWAELGVVPLEAADELRARAVPPSPESVAEIEARTHHDVAAFVDAVAEQVGPAARWLHYGLTSSDVLDTALALQVREAGALLVDGLDASPRRRRPQGRGAPRDGHGRAHARRPCRADRRSAPSSQAGRSSSTATGSGSTRALEGHAGRQACPERSASTAAATPTSSASSASGSASSVSRRPRR